MSSVSASRIKRETLYIRTISRACRADPGGYYRVYHSTLGPTAGQIYIYLLKKVIFSLIVIKPRPIDFI